MLFSIFCLVIAATPTFAMDNDTTVGVHNDTVIGADYYFDANVEDDTGDGSINNPYKELDTNRIPENAVAHLANGEYDLKHSRSYSNLSIIGQNPEKTVIRYTDAVGFTSKGSITLKNVKLVDLRININSNSNLTAINTIFFNSSDSDSVIRSSDGLSTIVLDNCTFSQNSAQYGGVININNGNLNITDCVFLNNHAEYYGGAIAGDGVEIHASNSKFISNYAVEDAGGAFYLKDSILIAKNIELINCSANFGGAITSLSSELNLNNCKAKNNRAKYYGGAIYKMYTSFDLTGCIFENNSALNGGALYVDNVADFKINSNYFSNNFASSTGGAVYSVLSDSYYSIVDKHLQNTFTNNKAKYENDVYQYSKLNLSVGSNNYTLMHYNSSYVGNLPKSYDLREHGWVTPVKNQDKGGNCWAFSAMAALESAILKATGTSYDLSEENMKNIASQYSSYGWSMDTNVGGYDKMAMGYLAGWLGPVNETEDIYNGKSVLSPLLNGDMHIQNIVFLTRDNFTDNNAIKKAILDYGAVSTSVYWSSSYIYKTKNYYYNGNSAANHAVAIVGWDDNYAASNFKTAPEGNGAWIIKNSWGLNSGDNGYFYVSYYDKRLAQPGKYVSYAFVLNDTIRYDKNYQYDIPGRTDYFFNQSSTVWYKTKFNATENEYLAAVSTYFEKDTKWELSIYVNDVLKLTQSGYANPSYKTIDLNSIIPLKAGDIFDIMFKITVNGDTGVPISESISLNAEMYEEGISFISYDGKNWADLYDLEWTYPDHSYNSQVACIKAFTVLNKINTNVVLEVTDSFNPVEITARVLTQYGTPVKSGVVTFNVEGKNIKANLKDGVAKLVYAFTDTGKNTVKATFTATGYSTSTSAVTVDPIGVILKANDFSTYFGSFYYSANLVDENNRPVPNKEIKFNVDNNEYIVKTDKNGLATVKLNLAVGNYKMKIAFNDMSNNAGLERNIIVKSTINMSENSTYTFNAVYSANLVDMSGNPLNDCNVNVSVNGEDHVLSTDSEGNLFYNIDLDPDYYQITITNPVTGEVKTQDINVVARITENNDLTMYYGAGKSYKVKVLDDNGNIANGVTVTFKINGNKYKRVTDSNGYASFKIDNTFNPKTYTITATYKGYKVSNKVTVKPTLILKDKTVKRSKTFTYTVKLLNNKGKILKNKYVKVKFKGKTYKAKTNSKGIATYKIKVNSKTGKYTITATYGSAKISKKITIK
jgi:predicted outer membrane repeat protein